MIMQCDDAQWWWLWWFTVMMMMLCDDGLWWWWCTVMMHCDDDNARWWYWIYHIYSVSLSISRTFLVQFGQVSCGSQRRKIPRFLGHCTPAWLPQKFRQGTCLANGGTFETRRYAYCSWKTFSERSCEATKKLHLYLVLNFLLRLIRLDAWKWLRRLSSTWSTS